MIAMAAAVLATLHLDDAAPDARRRRLQVHLGIRASPEAAVVVRDAPVLARARVQLAVLPDP